jgi:NADH oxidase (H2O2-forming)
LANSIDSDISKTVHEKISEHVTIYTDHVVTKVDKKNGRVNKIYFKDNQTNQVKEIETDLLVIAIGAKPNIKLAEKIGCKIGKTGSVVVNEKSETSIKDVYSAGDCTEYSDFITGKPVWVGLASIAVRQAISAGINASGGSYNYLSGVLQTRTSEFFDLEIAAVGPISKNLSDFSTVSGKFVGSSRLSYFPGGKPISIKVIVNRKNGHILGAQAVGDNAAQRINTLACAILGNIDVETFRKMETAYAPPIAPTLDAISIVCDIVSRKLKLNK